MFKKIVTSAIFIAAAISLTGCKEKKDEDYYLSHHDELLKMYSECLNIYHWENPEICVPVSAASRRLSDDPEISAGIKKIVNESVEKSMKAIPDFNHLAPIDKKG